MKPSYFDSSDVQHVLPTFSSPAIVMDADIIRQQMQQFTKTLPSITPFYSVKTNPHPLVIDTLLEFDSHFDAATLGEIDMLIERGADVGGILYTHPVKTADEIAQAAMLGVNAFTFDSLDELQRLANTVPGAHYFLRVTTPNNASLYDYKRKFGATIDEAIDMLNYAAEKTLSVAGISFMVGSQSMKLDPWRAALQQTLELFTNYYERISTFRIVNIGSGFPLQYAFTEAVPNLTDIAGVLNEYTPQFPADVQFIAEPGRFIAGPAAAIKTSVYRRIERSGKSWLYIDTNAYSGLIEIIESSGAFKYRISSNASGEDHSFSIAGKTLDPDDVFGMDVMLGNDTTEGNRLTIYDAGAYSTSFFTDYHNLPHPSVIVVDSKYQDNVELDVSSMQISGLRAKRDIQAGEAVFQVSGYFTKERTRTSFQVDTDRHIEPTLFGAFLNHSCDPNVGIRTNSFGYYDIIARRDITTGEDIAADYAMFEFETGPMSLVPCLCQSPLCRTNITGYKDLSPAQKDAYSGFVAAYLAKDEPAILEAKNNFAATSN